MVLAFAIAVQAGDAPGCQDKAKAGCCPNKVKTSLDSKSCPASDKAEATCAASKIKTSADSKGGCPFASGSCCKDAQAKKATAKQGVLQSPKAASFASN
jgi:hypothetical protein